MAQRRHGSVVLDRRRHNGGRHQRLKACQQLPMLLRETDKPRSIINWKRSSHQSSTKTRDILSLRSASCLKYRCRPLAPAWPGDEALAPKSGSAEMEGQARPEASPQAPQGPSIFAGVEPHRGPERLAPPQRSAPLRSPQPQAVEGVATHPPSGDRPSKKSIKRMVSARIRDLLPERPQGPNWHPVSWLRRADRSSISSFHLANLGGEAVDI